MLGEQQVNTERLDHSDEPVLSLQQRLDRFRRSQTGLEWQGNFSQYFDLAVRTPKITRLAHERVYDMIVAKGIDTRADGTLRYKFFEPEIFGLDKTVAQLVEYFHSSARRLETRKRILMEMGPVGGGKSTIVTLLKRGLEEYSRTNEGALYAIDGCPMHEEPMHLIPDDLRPEIAAEHDIHIEGDLCPQCRFMVDNNFKGNVEQVPVKRIAFSEKNRIGIGTFSPSDPKSQDITELTGSINLATIGEYGVESDPRAYRFDGELNIANRGMMEFIEMLKADEKFLYGLLTLTQEQSIKTSRFAMIYADEVVVSHTNENEYNAFAGNRKSEALQDRIIVVKVPYNLRVSDEVKIYEKLLHQSTLTSVHIAPNTLNVAGTFAVLSRLEAPKKAGMTLAKKLKAYDGQAVEGVTERDVKELQAETVREGMDGISPRYVVNRLSAAAVKDEIRCLNPIATLRALKDGLDQMPAITKEERDKYLNLVGETRKDYDELAKQAVQRAFVYSYEESAATLMNNYLDNVEAFSQKQKVKDPITDEERDPDEKLMRSIEEQVGITENAKKEFRDGVMIRAASLARKGQRFDYKSHDRLREAIEKKLFADLKDVVKITTSTKTPDADQLRRLNEVADRLVEHHGYCPDCANELLKYVGTLLNR